jgi:hypothetical protein
MNKKIIVKKAYIFLLLVTIIFPNALPFYEDAYGSGYLNGSVDITEPVITKGNVTANSIQLDVIFYDDNAYGNCMSLHQIYTDEWISFQPNLHLKSGCYQINGLIPNTTYEIVVAWIKDGKFQNITEYIKTNKSDSSESTPSNTRPLLRVFEKTDKSILWEGIYAAGSQESEFEFAPKNSDDWMANKTCPVIYNGKLLSNGLKSNTDYQSNMSWFDKSGKFYSIQMVAKTLAQPVKEPSIKALKITSNSIEWEIEFIDDNAENNSFSVLDTSNGESYVFEPDKYLKSGIKLSDNLKPDHSYVGILAWYGKELKSVTKEVRTLPLATSTSEVIDTTPPATPTITPTNTATATPTVTPLPSNSYPSQVAVYPINYNPSTYTPTATPTAMPTTTSSTVATTQEPATKPSLLPLLPPASEPQFDDIPKDYWASKYIYEMTKLGVFSGKNKTTTFRPSDHLTRAECITALTKLFGIYDENDEVSFSDVKKTDWYYKYIASAFRAGFTTGRPDGKFAPLESITRQDLCVILSRIIKSRYDLQSINKNIENNKIGILFADEHMVSKYAYDSVSYIVKLNILRGKPGNIIEPIGKTTRAELAKILYEVYNNFEKIQD